MKLLDLIVGEEEKFGTNKRILNAVIFSTTLFTVYNIIGGQLVGLPWPLVWPMFINFSVFAGIYALSRSGKYPILVRPIYITYGLITISAYYFLLNGVNGEVPAYFIMGAMLAITVSKKKYYYFLLSLWAGAFLACVIVGHYHPEWVSTYAEYENRGLEFVLASIGIMVLIAFMLILYKNLFEYERKDLRRANEKLEAQAIELERLKDEAERANKAKSEFLSTMSHEIRTPLNAVIGLSYILLKENPLPEQRSHLKILKFSAENLLSLINDILDFNKMEAGKLVLEETSFDVRELMEGVMSSFQLKAEEKGIQLDVIQPEEGVHSYYEGDVTRLTQVLNNLVSNAVKFTEKGFVRMSCSIEEEDEYGVLLFKVTDSGIGIPEDIKDKIFDSFIQAHSGITRKYGGTGLGLAISKELVRLMGADLKLESVVGEGTEFTFTLHLPRVKKKEYRSAFDVSTNDHEILKGVNLLVAEDNAINALVARKFLEGWGANIEIAKDGKEAIERWRHGQFDLILMDLRMPEMDGIQAATYIRKAGATNSNIPILALTASAMEEERNDINATGMNEYISKPFNPEELLGKIKKNVVRGER